jgi:hypothetical protein
MVRGKKNKERKMAVAGVPERTCGGEHNWMVEEETQKNYCGNFFCGEQEM